MIKVIFNVCVIGILTSLFGLSTTWNLDMYSSNDPQSLLETSFDSTSYAEKKYLRSYIAYNHPKTKYGLFAKAWIAGVNGEKEKKINLYSECIDKFDYAPCFYNIRDNYKGNIEDTYKHFISVAPELFDYQLIRNYYSYIKDDLKNKKRATRVLNNLEKDFPNNYIFDYVRGIEAHNNEDYELAEQYYVRSLEYDNAPFEVYNTLLKLRLNNFSTPKNKVDIVSNILLPLIQRNPRNVEALTTFAEHLFNIKGSNGDSFTLYKMAWDIHPTPEIMQGMITGKYIRSYPNKIKSIVSDAQRDLAFMPATYRVLFDTYYWHTGENIASLNTIKNAIKYSHIKMDKFDNTSALVTQYLGTHEYKKAKNVLDKLSNDFPSKKTINYKYYELYLAQGNEAKALKYYKKHIKITNNDSIYTRTTKYNLERIYYAKAKAKEYEDKHPFLKFWQNEFGESLKVSINFESGSDVIPSKYYSSLKSMAKVLKRKNAKEYIFVIEGHTDADGSALMNKQLSLKRADSVKNHLIKHYNIDEGRLITKGYGESFPLASNENTRDKKKNRRIELLPYGRFSQPQIMPEGALNSAEEITMSPDGQKIAIGHANNQIFDLRIQSKIFSSYRESSNKNFSPNGRYLVGSSSWNDIDNSTYYELSIFDVKTGFKYTSVKSDFSIHSVSWSPQGDEIAIVNNRGRLSIFNMKSKNIVRSVKLSSVSIAARMVWSKDGKYIYTAQAQRKTLDIWNAKTLERVKSISGVDWAHNMELSKDGKYLLIGDNIGVLSIFNTRTWEVQQYQDAISKPIAMHPTKPWVLLTDWSNNTPDIIFDYKKLIRIAEVEADGRYGYAFSLDGKLLYQSQKNKIVKLDTKYFKKVGTIESNVQTPRNIYKINKSDYFLTTTSTTTQVWDSTSGKRVHTWMKGLDIKVTDNQINSAYGLSEDEKILYEINLNTFTLKKLIEFDFYVSSFDIHGNNLVVGEEEKYKGSTTSKESSSNGYMHVYNMKTFDEVWSKKVDFVTERLKYSRLYRAGFSIITANHGVIAYSTSWQDGYGHKKDYTKEVTVVDIHTGEKVKSIKLSNPISEITFHKDSLEIVADGYSPIYDLKTYKTNKTGNEVEFRTIIKDGNTELRSVSLNLLKKINTGTKKEKTISFHDNLSNFILLKDKNLVVVLLRTGELEFYNYKTFAKQLTIIPKNNNEWLAFTPENIYDSSLNGTDKTFWKVGELILPFSTFKEKYHNPKVIKEQLQAIANNDTVGLKKLQTNKINIGLDSVNSPYKIKVINDTTDIVKKDSYTIKSVISIMKKTDIPLKLNIQVNGRVLDNTRGLKLMKKSKCDVNAIECREVNIKVPLEAGTNIIQIAIKHQNTLLDPKVLKITQKSKNIATNNHLWFFGIGVSEYNQNEYNLMYADADARAIAKSFKSQEGKLYNKVHIKLLTNKEVTEKNIKKAMHKFLKKASSQDSIVIFTAGHGAKDNDGRLYLMTHDSDLEEPYTGMSVSQFKDFLYTRPSTQKALFWMDICHAGAIKPEFGEKTRGTKLNSNEVVKMLSSGTGIAVMASSTGMESSLEGKKYGGGHGAYTSAILEGLKGKADLQAGNKDGVVTVLELQNYVSRRVVDTTDGRQHPMIPTLMRLQDYPLSFQ